MDEFLADDELGVLIRTDFSDESAWAAFAQKVRDAQAELVAELASPGVDADADADVKMDDEAQSAPAGEHSTSTTQPRRTTATLTPTIPRLHPTS